MSERRAPVNGMPYGSVSWAEHERAWQVYHRHHPDQSAETIAARGGFGVEELVMFLGYMPMTWRPSKATESWWRRFKPHPAAAQPEQTEPTTGAR